MLKLRVVALLAFALFSTLAASPPAQAAEFTLTSISKDKISELTWNREDFALQTKNSKTLIVLSGKFSRANWNLVYKTIKIPLDKEGKFLVRLPVTHFPAQILLKAVDPFGKIESETFLVALPAQKPSVESSVPKKIGFNLGVGYSSLRYQQTALSTLTETAITPKIALFMPIATNWDVALSSFFSAFVLSSSHSTSKATFLGVNGRIGYYPPLGNNSPWRVGLLFGFYYSTMMVNTNDFGFRNVSGPQLFPTLRYSLNAKNAVAGYFKFSPVSERLSLLSLSNREVAFGFSYTYTRANFHTLSLTADLATLNMSQGSTEMISQSTTIGLGYGF